MRHKVVVTNRLTELEMESVDVVRPFFTYKAPGYFFTPGYQAGSWDGNKSLIDRYGEVPTGLFISKLKFMETQGLRFDIDDQRIMPKFTDKRALVLPPGKEIRPYQHECNNKMMQASSTGGVLLNATGTGKTFIAALYFSRLKGKGTFIVDEMLLAIQAQTEISKLLGEPVGICGGGKFKPQRITVALIQTLQSRRGKPEYKLWKEGQEVLIYDEIHVALNNRTKEIIKSVQPKAVFGLTASLQMDKKHVGMNVQAICGPVLFEFPYDEALLEGVLAPGVVIGVDIARSHARRTESRILYKLLVVESKRRNRLIEELAREGLKRDYAVVVLVDPPGHAKLLHKLFPDIPHSVIHGGIKTKSRVLAKARFIEKKKSLLIANRVFKKGISIDRIDVIIDGAGLGNKDDAIQKFGRGVRKCDEKAGLLYFHIGDKKAAGSAPGSNRYTAGTKRCRAVFTGLKIPVVKASASQSATELFDLGEKTLDSIRKK